MHEQRGLVNAYDLFLHSSAAGREKDFSKFKVSFGSLGLERYFDQEVRIEKSS